jgi:hypothetical protein
MQFF